MAAAGGAALKASAVSSKSQRGERFDTREKEKDVRTSNIIAAKAVADAIRTSLGPKGMDKMIQGTDGEVIITNDGATIMSHMQVFHPTAKMLVELSKSQDIEAGDGTTSVVVLCGSLLDQCSKLLAKGIHPTRISEAFQRCASQSEKLLEEIAIPVKLTEREQLVKAATTSLASKVISIHSEKLAPLAVDAVLSVIDPETATNVDLRDVKVTKVHGGTIDDAELVQGVVLNRRASHTAGAPTRVENAKVALLQCHLSAPKTDMDGTTVVSDYRDMDRVLKEERRHILGMCKKIKDSGANVVLVQKSILRDAVNDLSLLFLARMKIMVVTNVERDDVDFICRTLRCKPVAHIDSLTPDKLGTAGLVEEADLGNGRKCVRMTDVVQPCPTCSLVVRGSNQLVLDESERSLHDALCVVRALVKKRFLIAGGGAPESEMALELSKWARTLEGTDAYCAKAFSEALEVIPYTLAENAGMHPIHIVTELRKQHAEGIKSAGINVRKAVISDILAENVVQPLLVTTSALSLATETVSMILKIDDIVTTR